MLSKFGEKIKAWREAGLKPWIYNEAVRNAVIMGRITADEYEEITGEPYSV